MRRARGFFLGEVLLAQAVPGFLLSVGWTMMYEVYHDEGSYYTTLMQEILEGDGFFPYFLASAILMAFPVGMVLDSIRQAVGETWLGLPRLRGGRHTPAPSPLDWMREAPFPPDRLAERYALYRHAWMNLLVPAKASGNLALVLLIFLAWFVVKIFRMSGWYVFSLAFIIGTPLVGLGLVFALLVRYATGLREFHRLVQESIFPRPEPAPPPAPDPGATLVP
jgi:hypothetical protein